MSSSHIVIHTRVWPFISSTYLINYTFEIYTISYIVEFRYNEVQYIVFYTS